jgi:endoglucanase
MTSQKTGGDGGDRRLRLNTVGYLPDHDKKASIAGVAGGDARFTVLDAANGREAFAGALSPPFVNADTGEELRTADFSGLRHPGRYVLDVPGVGRSAPFRVAKDVYNGAFYTVTRGMYLWRCGCAVSGKHGGDTFAHRACHTDDGYLDAVGSGHAKRDGTGGWHDAGDYNKYVVNAGVTVGVMFQAWERFGDRLTGFRLDLPESGKGTPDFLSELRWELEWLLKMQAADGSVYHKLTTRNFGGFIPPEEETADRLFTPWSSAATADFVAMAMQAARAFRPFDARFADRCRAAAEKSYAFLKANPADHRADLAGFRTGDYQTDDPDDRLWAAAETWETTGDPAALRDFEQRARALPEKVEANWDWGNVGNLGMVTYLMSRRPGRDAGLVREVRDALVRTADVVVRERDRHGYARPLGDRYYWGCNGTVARQTVVLQTANLVAPKRAYVEASLDALGHLFGRNVYGRSFVTGVGAAPPLHPHDRRSGGDKVEAPWPGYLIGGPWPKAADWKDEQGSYQTNEIAINWNGALIYALAAFVDPATAGKGAANVV